MAYKITRLIKRAVPRIAVKMFPVRWKEHHELLYWKERKEAEGSLSNGYYAHFYTKHFDIDDFFYSNKTILDIGCGPRGSLEWATMAKRRFGLDPLAKEYLKLGANYHNMEYLDSPAESIPLMDAECDVVFSFNSLDHVRDIGSTVEEIKRITKPGGLFLLLVEINHEPTFCEPHKLSPNTLIQSLEPEFICEGVEVYRRTNRGMYGSIRAGESISNPMDTNEVGYMSARFSRIFPN